MHPNPVTGELQNGIAKVRYSHDAMIDLIVAEPWVSQNQLAEVFDRTPGWISQVINSDAFQARLAERKEQLIDPVLIASIKDRLNGVAARSLELIQEKLNQPAAGLLVKEDFLLRAADLATKALGYGARVPTQSTTNVAVVVQVPPKIPSAHEWAQQHAPGMVVNG